MKNYKNNIVSNALILLAALVTLSACGGGSSSTPNTSTATASTNTTTTNNTNTTNSNTTTAEFKTADLVVSKDFTFDSARKLDVFVDVSSKASTQSNFSLCKNYTRNSNGSYNVDFDSCLLKTVLNNGQYQGNVNITNDVDKLISVVWFLDDIQNPQYNEINLASVNMINIQ